MFTCPLVLSCGGSVPSNEEAETVQSESDGGTEGGALDDCLPPSAPNEALETNKHVEQSLIHGCENN